MPRAMTYMGPVDPVLAGEAVVAEQTLFAHGFGRAMARPGRSRPPAAPAPRCRRSTRDRPLGGGYQAASSRRSRSASPGVMRASSGLAIAVSTASLPLALRAELAGPRRPPPRASMRSIPSVPCPVPRPRRRSAPAPSAHFVHRHRQQRGVGLGVRGLEHADHGLAQHVVQGQSRQVQRVGAQQRPRASSETSRSSRPASRRRRSSAPLAVRSPGTARRPAACRASRRRARRVHRARPQLWLGRAGHHRGVRQHQRGPNPAAPSCPAAGGSPSSPHPTSWSGSRPPRLRAQRRSPWRCRSPCRRQARPGRRSRPPALPPPPRESAGRDQVPDRRRLGQGREASLSARSVESSSNSVQPSSARAAGASPSSPSAAAPSACGRRRAISAPPAQARGGTRTRTLLITNQVHCPIVLPGR